MQRRGEQAGTAAEVDDPTRGTARDERNQVVERLLALGAKALVLSGIPGVAHVHAASRGRGYGGVIIGGQDSVALVRSRVWTGLAAARCVRRTDHGRGHRTGVDS